METEPGKKSEPMILFCLKLAPTTTRTIFLKLLAPQTLYCIRLPLVSFSWLNVECCKSAEVKMPERKNKLAPKANRISIRFVLLLASRQKGGRRNYNWHQRKLCVSLIGAGSGLGANKCCGCQTFGQSLAKLRPDCRLVVEVNWAEL